MAISVSYPGVYIAEIPSGVRTLTGVVTSIAVFVGRTLHGPFNVPVTINCLVDFERAFGGLWVESPLTFAVLDFILNGKRQSIIVRLFKPGDVDGKARITADEGKIKVSWLRLPA
jgi:phage tail sheath protein FI